MGSKKRSRSQSAVSRIKKPEGRPDHHHNQRNRQNSASVSPSRKKTSQGPFAIDSSRPNRLERLHTESRRNLPVYKQKADICRLVSEHEALLVVAETGSGKSTQIPAFLHESGCLRTKNCSSKYARSICVTQPRRVAATTVANRVAEEMGCVPGTVVGHRVRFDDCTDLHGPNTTRIIYATDGMLLREATSDPLLTRYSAVVLDEAHERSLQTDVLFGIVKRAMMARNNYTKTTKQPTRNDTHDKNTVAEVETLDAKIMRKMSERAKQLLLPPLRAVVMSATLDVETFQNFFPDAAMIKIPGRQYPVQTIYTREAQEDYVDAALNTVLQIVDEGEDGDVLVFLPGQEEIEGMASLLRAHLDEAAELSRSLSNKAVGDDGPTPAIDIVLSLKGMGTNINNSSLNNSILIHGVQVCVLYAALPAEVQHIAFQPKAVGCKRKVVLATNIAETSVTLSGIRYVVDCGKHKTRDFSGTTGMESLNIANISKAQAAQRTGRAGRVSSGFCFRLYTEDDFDVLEETTTPEILRVNLAHVVLQLKSCGIHDPRTFDFLTPPDTASLKKAFELLFALGAIDEHMKLTEHGKNMSKLPLDPTFAHLLLQSPTYGCVSEMLSAVAMLSTENVFYRPGGGTADVATKGDGDNSNNLASKAATAHRRFASYEGDLPTLLSIYEAWRKEAVYVTGGGKKAQKKRLNSTGSKDFGKMLHGEWCTKNFINGRALVRAYDVRKQLSEICSRDKTRNGLDWDVHTSCGAEMEQFLKCVCAGLFLQAAVRTETEGNVKNQRKNRQQSIGKGSFAGGRYRTKNGRREVSIHPTSTLFGRNPAPKCVVFCELLQTKKAYIRSATQAREDWLSEIAPNFFKNNT